MADRPESTIRAEERDRCRREARAHPKGQCPCCGRQTAEEYERALRSKERQIQRLLTRYRDLSDYAADVWDDAPALRATPE